MQVQLRAADPARFPEQARFQGLRDGGQLQTAEATAAAIVRFLMSMPVLTPAAVQMRPSRTKIASRSTETLGYMRASRSQEYQCVAARLPSRIPALARTKAPSQTDAMRIQEIEFHHGGNAKPGVVVANWKDYKRAGPFLFSLDHHGKADGHPFRLTFTNVAVKLEGSDTWVEPKTR